MPAILTPALALRYLHELSTDLRAAVVLAEGGELLAGDAAAAAPARELAAALDAAGVGARELLVRVEDGGRLRGFALVARVGGHGDTLALATGPHVLLPLLRHDVAAVVEGLAPASADAATEGAASPRLLPPGEVPAPFVTPSPVTAIDADGRPKALEPADFAGRTAIFAGTGLLSAGGDAAARRR